MKRIRRIDIEWPNTNIMKKYCIINIMWIYCIINIRICCITNITLIYCYYERECLVHQQVMCCKMCCFSYSSSVANINDMTNMSLCCIMTPCSSYNDTSTIMTLYFKNNDILLIWRYNHILFLTCWHSQYYIFLVFFIFTLTLNYLFFFCH